MDELLPQANTYDMATLNTVEVCLAHGLIASKKEEFATKIPRQGLNANAIYGNWNAETSAHHDMILPVRYTLTKKATTFAVSTRNGHHKTESDLIGTKQHFVRAGGKQWVAGIIQAFNPRHKQTGRTLKKDGVYDKLTRAKKYAEVTMTKGHVHHILSCFD